MHLLNRPHAHDLGNAVLVAASRFGQPLLAAAALAGIVLMMSGTDAVDAWTGVAVMALVAWLAPLFRPTRR